MNRDNLYFLLLNFGHFLDHLFTLIFATVAALALHREWGLSYAELLVYATPGFFAFGVFALPAGWLADKWSRDGMMVVFFVGIGLASLATSLVRTPLELGIGLFVIGMFAAIYHPVGLAIVTLKWRNTGIRLAANGVWGNLGVASAALITGFLIDHSGWRMAFVIPGLFSICVGIVYGLLRRETVLTEDRELKQLKQGANSASSTASNRNLLIRVSAIVFLTTAVSSIIFQSTTFALPKIFDERLQGLAEQLSFLFQNNDTSQKELVASMIGGLAFIVFAVASTAQLVVGSLLDKFGPRRIFMTMAAIQLCFFSLMPSQTDGLALAVALGFMIGAFGQIPINDFMISKMASGPARARIYGIRYVVSFTVLAVTLPLIAFVYDNWGFDTLFYILAATAFVIFAAVYALPRTLPTQQMQTQNA